MAQEGGLHEPSKKHRLLANIPLLCLSRNLEQAEKYGKLCLEFSENEEPFYLSYAHEALARTAALAGKTEEKNKYIKIARNLAKKIKEKDEKELILADLITIT